MSLKLVRRKSIPKQKCFDICVKDTHCFYANGILVHNSNAGIVWDAATDSLTYQSRERELSLTSDNAGFMLAQKKNEQAWLDYFHSHEAGSGIEKIAVYGEWCGKGIQKGVAVSELEKMFVIFGVKYVYDDGESIWGDVLTPEDLMSSDDTPIPGVYDIEEFGTWEIDIDFNCPELSQNKLIEMTLEVERECPVGKHFGVSGIGEGIVFQCVTEGWRGSSTLFKSKGQKHSVTKVSKLNSVDVEAVENIRQFVEYAVTEARLEWALNNLLVEQQLPIETSSMGSFIRTVFNDVMKEEEDVIINAGIDVKKIGSAVANKARPWFISKVNEGVGL